MSSEQTVMHSDVADGARRQSGAHRDRDTAKKEINGYNFSKPLVSSLGEIFMNKLFKTV